MTDPATFLFPSQVTRDGATVLTMRSDGERQTVRVNTVIEEKYCLSGVFAIAYIPGCLAARIILAVYIGKPGIICN